MEPVIRWLSQWRSFTTKPDGLSWSLGRMWKWMETIKFELYKFVLWPLHGHHGILVLNVSHMCAGACVFVCMCVSLCHSPCVEDRGQLAGVGSVLLSTVGLTIRSLGGRHLYLLNNTNVRADGSRKESERAKAWQSRGWAHPWDGSIPGMRCPLQWQW